MEKLEKLIRFCGYGNYDTSNIIFLGNEEGLGGGEIEEEISKRTQDFWDIGYALDGQNKENGYYVKGEGAGNAKGHFLLFCARLMLQLNDQRKGDYFFNRQSEDTEAFKMIEGYKINILYNEGKEQFNYRSVLVDLGHYLD